MGTVARSPLWKSDQTEPDDTILISPGGNAVDLVDLITDTSNIKPGLCTYISANTYPNEVTESGAVHGDDSRVQTQFSIEIPAHHIRFPGNYEKDVAFDDLDPCQGFEHKPGMKIWMKGTSLTCLLGENLTNGANGLVTNVGDPDGVAIDISAFVFKALAPMTSGTWVPCLIKAKTAFDKTA